MANDHDPDGNALTVVGINLPAGVTNNGDGTFTYDPQEPVADDFQMSFSYRLEDGRGGQDTATVIVGSVLKAAAVDLSPTASFILLGCDLARNCGFDGRFSFDDNGITDFDWSFGDTSSTTVQATGDLVEHAYTESGSFTVKLTVTDTAGQKDAMSQALRVDLPPAAAFTVGCGDTRFCTFTDKSADDLDTPTFEWDFGDGSALDSRTSPSHTYLVRGLFTPRLTLRDSLGQQDSASVEVLLPEFFAGCGALAGRAERECAFSATFQDEDLPAGVGYTWDFGDGSAAAAGDTATHLYGEEGKSFPVKLTAAGPLQTGLRLLDLAVPGIGADCADTGAEAEFLCDLSGLPSQAGFYTWAFGDGSVASGETLADRPFASSGVFDLTLEIRDLPRQQGSTSAELVLPDFTAGCGPVAGRPEADCGFSASPSGTALPAGVTYAWDFGDGTTGAGESPTHAYATPGQSFPVELTAAEDNRTSLRRLDLAVPALQASCEDAAGSEAEFLCDLSALPSQPGLSYLWDFGDGTTGSGETIAERPYGSSGVFDLSLEVQDSRQQSSTAAGLVLPDFTAGCGPVAGRPEADCGFSATPAGAALPAGVGYTWDFGDGGLGSGETPTHAYATPGQSFPVALTAAGDAHTGLRRLDLAVPALQASCEDAGSDPEFLCDLTALPSQPGLSYLWDFGDGTSGSGETIADRPYGSSGVFELSLEVQDSRQQSSTAAGLVLPDFTAGCGPVAGRPEAECGFSATPSETALPAGVGYAWDFGDGSQGTGESPAHAYATPGESFPVALTAAGDAHTGLRRLDLAVPALQASCSDFACTLVGRPSQAGLAYAWSFGDGATASGETPSHTYASSGLFDVALELEGPRQESSTAARLALPEYTAGCGAAAGLEDGSCTFTATPASTQLPPGVAYSWDFGDGSPQAPGDAAEHTYDALGALFPVELTSTDGAEQLALRHLQLAVPELEADCTNLACAFSGLPSATGLAYDWDFGDGASDSGETPAHTYAASGLADVRLDVTTARQATSRTTRVVLPAFEADCFDLDCTFTASPTLAEAGEGFAYTWDLGDGTTATGEVVAHTFPDDGFYPVAATAGDGLRTATAAESVEACDETTLFLIIALN